MNPIKKYFPLLGLVVAGFFISVVLAEICVRVFFPHSRDHVTPAGMVDIDLYLGWNLNPRKSFVHHSSYFDAPYTINSLGYRDKPRSIYKDKNVYRILLHGDSQIFGWGVPEDKRFSNLIETQKQNLEIWNLAVPAYGLDQEILSYERDGKSLNGDEVIFFVSEQTLGRTKHSYIHKKYKPMFVMNQNGVLKLIPIPEEKAVARRLASKILSRTYLPYFLEYQLAILEDRLKGLGDYRKQTEAEKVILTNGVGDLEKKMILMARDIAVGRKQRIRILAELPEAKRKDFRDFCGQEGIGFLEIVFDYNKR
ncbi:MAG: hypothetical protein ACREOB_03200, partial [Thermodesulfobacteriota bacterium]